MRPKEQQRPPHKNHLLSISPPNLIILSSSQSCGTFCVYNVVVEKQMTAKEGGLCHFARLRERWPQNNNINNNNNGNNNNINKKRGANVHIGCLGYRSIIITSDTQQRWNNIVIIIGARLINRYGLDGVTPKTNRTVISWLVMREVLITINRRENHDDGCFTYITCIH